MQLVAEIKNPLLINGNSSCIWDGERALIDPKYPQQPDIYEGQYWVHRILRNGTEFLVETIDGSLVEVHQDNASLV